jgi:hypothetical protein
LDWLYSVRVLFGSVGQRCRTGAQNAGVAQLVARFLAKEEVAGSKPVIRSSITKRAWLELVYAYGSDPYAREGVGVRISPRARSTGRIRLVAYSAGLLTRLGATPRAFDSHILRERDQGGFA